MTIPATDSDILDQIIVGRVEPHIYAFKTNTIPNYLKVGDTYRPVAMRLHEWRRRFPDLTKVYEERATVSDDVYFRDFAVHRFLETDLGKRRLTRVDLEEASYYSREFFGETSAQDVQDAVADIRDGYHANANRYDYYYADDRLPIEYHYPRGPKWELRPNQRDAVERFRDAVSAGRTNLLMYAVMRFGKSFTSLCCATAINARTVLVVSAKADVRAEWKRTVESAGNFEGYVFLDSSNLIGDPNAIETALDQSRGVVLFLTLQDLQGASIKDKHEELFEQELDLLIIDETHFGARADEYGRVLRDSGQPTDDSRALARGEDDLVDLAKAEEQLKVLRAKRRLHLSGTPYRILMGSEFTKEDIISFVQFADIVRDQEEWDRKNLAEDEPREEWENPYFGFPQMVRFAFKPSRLARDKMDQLSKSGVSLALSALLEPRSIKQDPSGLHKQFRHQAEILDLLRAIDGSQRDDNVLGFLDYDRIKDGMMCRHIVMVLPYCASCDAMEELIEIHRAEFANLGEYDIINISGVEGAKRYKTPEQVKSAIKDSEGRGRKTLTLTVNRMLTGSTVEQWDTMIYLKDTSSPQEYDQAVFRLQNQYTRTLRREDSGQHVSSIKHNLKPQTLLVDFDPDRLFRMQEQKSLIYNVNTDANGNSKLKERVEEELRISPIVTMNLGRIHRVDAANILEAISEYSSNRSIADEARDVPVDLDLLDNPDIRRVIEAQNEIGSRAGLTLEPVEGDENDIEAPDIDVPDETDGDGDSPGDDDAGDAHAASTSEDDAPRSLAKKLQTYYQRILFFAMLTPTHVRSLGEIVGAMEGDDNLRIARHLGLDPATLRTLHDAFDPFKLSSLDYKIQNISQLVRDESLEPIDRAARALNKFSRISESEVRTPSWLCEDMINQIPSHELVGAIQRGEPLLDIASKSGEFAVALVRRLTGELGVQPELLTDAIWAVPTSSIGYEFTRRFYEVLGLNVSNVASDFTAYDLILDSAGSRRSSIEVAARLRTGRGAIDGVDLEDEKPKGSGLVKFGAVVGNPPYQASDGGFGNSAASIYPHFVDLAKQLDPRFMSMVIPSRWFTGGKGLDDFRAEMLGDDRVRTLHDYLTASDVFADVGFKGGVCYFLWDRDNPGDCTVTTQYKDEAPSVATRPLLEEGADVFIRFNEGLAILKKVIAVEGGAIDSLALPMSKRFSNLVSARKPFALPTSFRAKKSKASGDVKVYQNGGTGFLARGEIVSGHELIDKWKIYVSYAAPGTGNKDTYPHRVISTPFLGDPGSISTETYLAIGPFASREEADSALSYLSCRLTRLLIQLRKASQHVTSKVYSFVPTQDWTQRWTDEDLYAKYGLSPDEIAFVERMVRPLVSAGAKA